MPDVIHETADDPDAGRDAASTSPGAAAAAPLSHHVLLAAGVVVVVVGIVVRCWPRGALWLDEAQSVAIARRPWSDLVGALREDGAPPLYSVLLHVWTDFAGTSDVAVRALTVAISVAFAGAVVVAARLFAGRRAMWCALVLVASSSFAVRYASEARMYALVMLEATLALLAVRWALQRPSLRRVTAVALATAALPYTHYWGLYLVAVGATALAVAAFVGRDRERRRRRRRVLLGVSAGIVLWLPWLPVFWFQRQHTGTPWTQPADAWSVVDSTFRWNRSDLAGGLLLAVLALCAAAGAALGRRVWRDADIAPWSLAVVTVATLLVAAVGGASSGSAYVGRYTSIAFPFAVVLAATGLAALASRRACAVVLLATWLLGTAYTIDEIRTPRTRATRVAEALEERAGPGDVVVFCPDQLAPAVERLLERSPAMSAVERITYPDVSTAERVDWVDYATRYDGAQPRPFVEALDSAHDRATVWLVWSATYPSTQDACQRLFRTLTAEEGGGHQVLADDPQVPDHGGLWRFGTAG